MRWELSPICMIYLGPRQLGKERVSNHRAPYHQYTVYILKSALCYQQSKKVNESGCVLSLANMDMVVFHDTMLFPIDSR